MESVDSQNWKENEVKELLSNIEKPDLRFEVAVEGYNIIYYLNLKTFGIFTAKSWDLFPFDMYDEKKQSSTFDRLPALVLEPERFRVVTKINLVGSHSKSFKIGFVQSVTGNTRTAYYTDQETKYVSYFPQPLPVKDGSAATQWYKDMYVWQEEAEDEEAEDEELKYAEIFEYQDGKYTNPAVLSVYDRPKFGVPIENEKKSPLQRIVWNQTFLCCLVAQCGSTNHFLHEISWEIRAEWNAKGWTSSQAQGFKLIANKPIKNNTTITPPSLNLTGTPANKLERNSFLPDVR